MKRNHLAILAGALAIGCMAWSGSALADGVLMGPTALPAAERAVLMAQVRDALLDGRVATAEEQQVLARQLVEAAQRAPSRVRPGRNGRSEG